MGSTIGNATQLGTHATRAGQPQRVPWWKQASDCQTPAEFAAKMYETTTPTPHQGYGFWCDPANPNDIYLRLPGGADPNLLYVTGSGTNGLVLNGADIRLCGLEVRGFEYGVYVQDDADRFVADHCLFRQCYADIRFAGVQRASYAGTIDYPVDALIEHCAFEETRLWDESGGGIAWTFIKNQYTGWASNRMGEKSETAAVYHTGGAQRWVFRRNRITGHFNGVACYHDTTNGDGSSKFDRYSSAYGDIHDCTFEQIADDPLEPEGATIGWDIWSCLIRNSFTLISVGPIHFGPVTLLGIRAWRQGTHGVADLTSGALGIKFSGASTPKALVHLAHITFWTDQRGAGDTTGGRRSAQGGDSNEKFWMRNCIWRTTRHCWEAPTAAGNWNENYNDFATADTETSRGLEYGVTYTTNVAAYRAASGQGANTNTNGHFQQEAVIDGGLTDPANGNLVPLTAGIFDNTGTAISGVSEGAFPDRGYTGLATYSAPAAGGGGGAVLLLLRAANHRRRVA